MAPRCPGPGQWEATAKAARYCAKAIASHGATFSAQRKPARMILRRCSRGCEPQAEPLCWTVSAWNRADGVRVAYKQKLCLACVGTTLAPMHVASESPSMTCPACGIDTADDMDAVYVSWIPRGVGVLKTDAPFCPPCAARYRLWAQEGAEFLEDREAESRGRELAPRYSAASTLRALGLTLPDDIK